MKVKQRKMAMSSSLKRETIQKQGSFIDGYNLADK
jgi:hypothetical protein